jgi:peptidoglycan/LPS O-acetylase OafA/YrhL
MVVLSQFAAIGLHLLQYSQTPRAEVHVIRVLAVVLWTSLFLSRFCEESGDFRASVPYGNAAELRKSGVVKEKLTSFGAAIVGAGALAVQMFLFHGAFGLPQIILLGVFFIPVVCGNDYFGVLSRRVSIYLGEISYSIYLMHGIILFVIFQMSPAPWFIEHNLGLASLFPLAAVLSVLIPTLTHKYIEIPGIRLGRSCNENRSSRWREIFAQQK